MRKTISVYVWIILVGLCAGVAARAEATDAIHAVNLPPANHHACVVAYEKCRDVMTESAEKLTLRWVSLLHRDGNAIGRPCECATPRLLAAHAVVLYKCPRDNGLTLDLGRTRGAGVVAISVSPSKSPVYIKGKYIDLALEGGTPPRPIDIGAFADLTFSTEITEMQGRASAAVHTRVTQHSNEAGH